jgi:hypothetical protein
MNNQKHKELYRELMNIKFRFIEPGQYHLQEIYEKVKHQYPEYCDDSIICSDTCTRGTQNPEWQHRVRSALGKLKSSSIGISKGSSHGYWVLS